MIEINITTYYIFRKYYKIYHSIKIKTNELMQNKIFDTISKKKKKHFMNTNFNI